MNKTGNEQFQDCCIVIFMLIINNKTFEIMTNYCEDLFLKRKALQTSSLATSRGGLVR